MDSETLVENIINNGFLKTPAIINSFKKIDRKYFVLPDFQDEAYFDYPLPIGFNQTISQPTTVAFMLELLQPQLTHTVLDIGSGSGFTSALLAELVGKNGMVYGLEIIPELVKLAEYNLKNFHFTNIINRHVSEVDLDKLPKFDRILVSASATEIPDKYIALLKNNSIMVIPVLNSILKVEVKDDKININEYPGFVFVPLIK